MRFKIGDHVLYKVSPNIHTVLDSFKRVSGKLNGIVQHIEKNTENPKYDIITLSNIQNYPDGYSEEPTIRLYARDLVYYNPKDSEKRKKKELIEKIDIMWKRQNYYKKHYGKSNHKTLKETSPNTTCFYFGTVSNDDSGYTYVTYPRTI